MFPNKFISHLTQWKKLGKLSFFCCLSILIISIAVLILIRNRPHKKQQKPPPDVSKILPKLRHGDIILRSGVGIWSEYIRDYNKKDKRFSHVGIVFIEKGKIQVLHAEGDDVTGQGTVGFDSLETFVRASEQIGISRFHTVDGTQVAAEAKKFLGRPFDWKFNLQDDSACYCTELIEHALRRVIPGKSLKLSGKVIPVDACLDPELFTEVVVTKENSGN